MNDLTVLCPSCQLPLARPSAGGDGQWTCAACGLKARGNADFAELGRPQSEETSDHYSLQWGEDMGFLKFIQNRPQAKSHMASAELGWHELFEEIRGRAEKQTVRVVDAACGYGGISAELVNERTAGHIRYLGADIHQAIEAIPKQVACFDKCGMLVRWDISNPVPVADKFDYVICRNALHHTPDPVKTFASLTSVLAPGGKIVISVYRKKAICREAMDDRLREAVIAMEPQQAFKVSREFALLGQALQKLQEKVEITEDLNFLGISKGEYNLQSLIYVHFLKCFYNPEFGERYSTLVNYDWYHPPYAYRYSQEEVDEFFSRNGLRIVKRMSSAAQHYVVGERPE